MKIRYIYGPIYGPLDDRSLWCRHVPPSAGQALFAIATLSFLENNPRSTPARQLCPPKSPVPTPAVLSPSSPSQSRDLPNPLLQMPKSMDGESVEDGREISAAGGSVAVALPAKPVHAGGRSRANPHWWAGRKFMQEVWRRGDPELLPNSGYVLLQRTSGMDALEAQYRGRVLLAVAVGDRIGELTGEALLGVPRRCASRRPPLRTTFGSPSRRRQRAHAYSNRQCR